MPGAPKNIKKEPDCKDGTIISVNSRSSVARRLELGPGRQLPLPKGESSGCPRETDFASSQLPLREYAHSRRGPRRKRHFFRNSRLVREVLGNARGTIKYSWRAMCFHLPRFWTAKAGETGV